MLFRLQPSNDADHCNSAREEVMQSFREVAALKVDVSVWSCQVGKAFPLASKLLHLINASAPSASNPAMLQTIATVPARR